MRKISTRAGISRRNGRNLQMVYSVKPEEVSDSDGKLRKCYGIEIVAYPGGEYAYARAVTTSRGYALRLTGILSRYSVTPTTLHDVVYDLLCADAEL